MGLLDDAIREHLELKRRRGADPTEIEQLEREALGPVRPVAQEHAPEVTDYDDEDEPLAGEATSADDLGHESDFEDEADWEDEYEFLEREGPHADQGEAETQAPASREGRGVEPSPEPADEHEHPADSHDHQPYDRGAETVEYDVETQHAAETGEGGKKEGEDVLEETPEFLQDAPDHDRLWFEQRPPRDFDFDG
jgi:hypothetical protein